QQVALRIGARLRAADTFSRIGGDEFVAVIGDIDSGGIAKVCESLVRAIAEPFLYDNINLPITASIGAALFPVDGTSARALQRHADVAMYRAKERGRNTFHMFSAELMDKIARRQQIEQYLQDALEQGFQLLYQPVYSVAHELVGLEALI